MTREIVIEASDRQRSESYRRVLQHGEAGLAQFFTNSFNIAPVVVIPRHGHFAESRIDSG